MPKDGKSRGKQAYRCGDYGRRHTPLATFHRPSAVGKEQALQMYAESSSLSAISRIVGYGATAVLGRVKKGESRSGTAA